MFESETHIFDRTFDVLVFPDAHDLPASAGESHVCEAIPFNVAPQLGAPVPLIPGGLPAMLWTYMPEAAVNKHSDLVFREDDVRPDPDADGKVKPVVLAKPVAKPVKLAAEQNLRLGV